MIERPVPLTLEVRKAGSVCILHLSGTLTFPNGTASLRAASRDLIARGERNFVLNMLDVPWLDSAGIGEVVACYKRAREHDGVVKLVLREQPYVQFTYCHLEKMFEFFGDEVDAVASFT